LYQQLGYKYDTLENKIKVTLEFFHNHSNLRTICRKCHKQVTSTYLSNKSKIGGKKIILENS
jgi:5-methylcytosine-specific restriction endonuclease McrA